MSQLQLFARLAKVDEAKRQVTGIIASETPDHANEVFDYATSKPNLEKWSGEMAKLSDGKSVGNVRAMHGKVAAGRLTDITFDDLNKTVEVVADIVDDNEWDKITKGVYTGFSIGGKYGRKWKDNTLGKTRYTAVPSEVSLVDMGCNPDATFQMLKADGMEEQVAFVVPGQDELLAKIADPEVTQVERADAMQRLAKAHGISLVVDPAQADDVEVEDLQKGAYSTSSLCRLAEDVLFLTACNAVDFDGNVMPFSDDLKKAATALYDALLKMVNVDVEAAKTRLKEMKKMFDDQGEDTLQKLRDRVLVIDQELGVGTALSTLVNENLGKFVGSADNIEVLNKFIADHDELQKSFTTLQTEHGTVKDELEKLKGEPRPAKGAVKAAPVDKADDGKLAKVSNTGKVDDEPKDESPLAKMRQAHMSPMRVGPANGGTLAKVGE